MSTEGVLTTQGRVIGALILRETRTAFGDSQLGYFWAVFQPAVGTLALVAIFSVIGRMPPLGESFALFFGTGVFTFQFYQKLSQSIMTAVPQSRGLLTYPLVNESDLVIAKFIFIAMTYVLIMFVFFGALIGVGEGMFPKRFEVVTTALMCTALLGLGAGQVNAVIFRLWPTWKQVESIISRPMFFISGIFFLPTDFPPAVTYWLSWNPVLHCIEWMREGYYGYYESAVLDKPYLLVCTLILLLVGFAGDRLYQKKV
ncbi:ABC transporter permease [Flexibacterium corallicola]|uniref:ABC transporter permease n=1 Tax=Flexibacterium corallicola TaxID=3037259 RepID=UPI00286F095F|nr:ABC transporter permease [Pseudovibrio sp. M1P-2-3]